MPSTISYPIKMIRTTALSLLFLVSSTTAFAPAPSSRPMQRSHQFAQYMSASSLEVVDETTTSIDDAFKNYQCTDGQTTIATKDTKVGSGYTIGDSDSQLLQMKYTCRFLDSKFTANIKAFDVSNMVFQTGEQRILPGLEEGIQGMKVGGTRLVKVPPSRGYGDKWFRGVIPPNSHLEFNVELLNIAQNPGEEFMMKLEQFGVERAAGAALCFAYLAFSPILQKNGFPF